MRRFPLDKNYAFLLENQNISISEVLRRAGLPEDLFARKDAFLTDEEYMRFMDSIDRSVQNPEYEKFLLCKFETGNSDQIIWMIHFLQESEVLW